MDVIAVGKGFGLDAAIELVGSAIGVDAYVAKVGSKRSFKLTFCLFGQRAAAPLRPLELALDAAACFKTILALLLEHTLHCPVADSTLELKDVVGRKGARIGKGALNRRVREGSR